jgi:translocation and assembly module TamB
MTDSPQTPQDKSTRPRRRWLRVLAYSGIGIGTVTVAGGIALTWWIKEELGPTAGNALTAILQRPITVGKLESVGIGYLKFGPSSVPPTATNPDRASTNGVEVRFPLLPLLSRTVKLNVTLADAEAYIHQRPDGSFEIPQIAAGEPGPINIEVQSLRLPGLQATIQPTPQPGERSPTPIKLTIDNATIRTENQQQRALINLDGSFASGATFDVAVDARLPEQYTKLAVETNSLNIQELAPLIPPTVPVQVPTGEVSADVSLEIIDNQELQNLNGSVNLQGIQAKIEGLSKPIFADGKAALIGNRAVLDNLTVNYGAIATKIDGEARLGPNYDPTQASFDLAAEITPVEIDTLLNAARDELDLQLEKAADAATQQQLREIAANLENLKTLLDGEIATKIALTGSMPSPTISGQIETTQFTRVDRLGFNQIATKFELLPQFDPQFQLIAAGISFSDLIIKPTLGGEITGSGTYQLIPEQTGETESSQSKENRRLGEVKRNPTATESSQSKENRRLGEVKRNPTAFVGFRSSTQPTSTSIIMTRGASPTQFAQSPIPNPQSPIPNSLNIDLQIKNLPVGEFARRYGSTLSLPLGNLSATVKATGPMENVSGRVLWNLAGGVYPAKGKINIANSQATIEEAIANIGSGNLQLDGFANLENWEVTATVNRIPLDALQPLEPLGLPPGLEGTANGQVRAAGPSSNFTPNAIAASGNVTVDIAGGTASVTGQLNNGRWQVNANFTELQLNELERLATTRNPVSLRNPLSGDTTRNPLSGDTTRNPVSQDTARNPVSLRNPVSQERGIFDRGDGSLNLRGNFNGSLDNLTQINGNSTATIKTLGGNINANANLDSGQIRATVETNQLALNPLIDLGIEAADSTVGNELKERANRLKYVEPKLTARANVSANLANLSPNGINGNLTASLQVNGQIDEGAIATDATLNSGNFQGDVNTTRLALSDIEELLKKTGFVPSRSTVFPREADGKIEAEARLSGNINNLTPEAVNLDANAKLIIAGGTINTSATVNSGQFQTSVNTSRIAVNPLLNILEEILDSEAVELDKNQVDSFKEQLPTIAALNSTFQLAANASGNLNNLTPNAINGNLDANLIIDGSAIEANGSLNRGQFEVILDTDKIALSDLERTLGKTVPDAELPMAPDGDIDVSGRISGNIENLNPEALSANLEANLRVENNRANAVANLNYGVIDARVNAEPIPLSFLEEIGTELGLIPASFLPLGINGEVEVQGSVSGTIAALSPPFSRGAGALSPPFSRGAGGDRLAGNLTGQVRLDEGGAINLLGNLQGQGWEASIISDRLALSQFSELIEKQEAAETAVNGIQQARSLLGQRSNAPILTGFLDGEVNISGSSLTNFSPEAIRATGNLGVSELPVLLQPFDTAFNWNGDRLEIEKATTPGFFASGIVDVDFIQKPGFSTEISNIDINLEMSDFDFESLPQQQLLNSDSSILIGLLNFDGRIRGNLENLRLGGDVLLENLTVNQIAFDPVLAGGLNLALNEGLDLQLAGNNDRIEVALDEEFFPSSFLVKLDEAVAKGIVRGEDLAVELDDFPLQALQIVPVPNIGVVSGFTSADLTVFNLKSFDINEIRADGKVAIDEPAVGYIEAKSFGAEINYANGVGEIAGGKLILGESEYLLDATVDLKLDEAEFNPEFAAALKVTEGKAQDILTALKWFSIEEITQQAASGFKEPVYGKAADLETAAVGIKNAPLLLQLRRLIEIQALLERQERLRETAYPVEVPPLSELSVTFDAAVNAEGSLKSGIEGDFAVTGDEWRWGVYAVDNFLLEGTYQNEVLTVLPLRFETEGGSLNFSGVVSPETFTGQLIVESILLEELQKFAKDLPTEIVNVKGELNAVATVGGTLANPRAIGDINITNGSINDQPIQKAVTGFSYNNARLNFGGDAVITGEEPILFLGTIPYQLPFAEVAPDNDVINISMELKDEALKIVNLFTDQIIVEDAQAEVGLLVGGTLAAPKPQGRATITEMTVRAAAFPDPLTDIKGSVLFTGDRLQIEDSLTGSLSDGTVTVTGVLPILEPLSAGDPDIEKPLTVALNQLNIDYERFFQGEIDGRVIVTGAALSPIIGGDVAVSDGRVLLNEAAGFASQFATVEETPIVPTGEEFEILLNDLEVSLTNRLRMISTGLANFQVIGNLTLNGSASDPAPSGEIDLLGGTINLFSTDLRLDRDYPNTAIFYPSLGLNPVVDLGLEASVLETSRSNAPTAPLSSEVADTPIQGGLGSSRKIQIIATVRGLLTEAQDNLELTSVPQRTESQIISLLGGSIVDTFRDDSTLALANIASTTLFSGIEQDVLDATGLSEFRLFPARTSQPGSERASELGVGLEVGLDVTKRLGASVTQIFAANAPTEFSLRYNVSDRVTFRGGTNFQDNSVFSVEYQLEF